MTLTLALSQQTGVRLAEIGFLLIGIAGVWMAAAGMPQLRIPAARSTLTGLLIAVGALLLIIATHWGHF